MNKLFYLLLVLNCISLYAQEDKEKKKALIESDKLLYEANKEIDADNFVEAEVNYRKAISKNTENATAKYNLGNAYYNNDSYGEAFSRFKQAGETAVTKEQKHKAYHNMGNVFMKNKEYEKAVEAYKEALRNNPTDEETRYNLALAKEMLKKQEEEQEEQKDDQKKDDKEDKKDDQENKDKGEDKKDEQGEPKDEKEDENKDKGGDEEENKEDKGDQKEDQQQKQGNEGDKKEEKNGKQQPRPNQMSPQQVKNMLRAIEEEEKKVQEKINAQKVKGRPVSTEKDW